MINIENAREFVRLARIAKTLGESGRDWEEIYDKIFSDKISGAVRKTGIRFEYYDPDMNYEDDVRAYVNAITERAEEVQKVVDAADLAESEFGESEAENLERVREFVRLTKIAKAVAGSGADSRTIREVIFSDDICGKIRDLEIDFDYVDYPDSDKERVDNFVFHLESKCRELEIILGAVDQIES